MLWIILPKQVNFLFHNGPLFVGTWVLPLPLSLAPYKVTFLIFRPLKMTLIFRLNLHLTVGVQLAIILVFL